MICDASDIATSAHNGRPARSFNGEKSPARSPEENLAWAIMEQAIDDLVVFCRWGLITPRGKCMPWPRRRKISEHGYLVSELVKVAHMTGPNDHKELVAWFNSDSAQEFCDLIGCRLPAREIFESTIKNHGGLSK